MKGPFDLTNDLSRRAALRRLGGLALAGALPALTPGQASSATIATNARIVVVGAGAAGLTMAAKLQNRLAGAQITVIDGRTRHLYQPGLTLVAAGLWRPEAVISQNARWMPRDVKWIEAMAAEYDPEANTVTTTTGVKVPYDFLVVAPGLSLDYEGIAGMSEDLIGRHGIASVYAGPEAAAKTAATIQAFAETGGTGLFGRPDTDIKCAGAPLKITFLTEERLRMTGKRGNAQLLYNAHSNSVFAVPPVAEKVESLFSERGIAIRRSHNLIAIEPGRKRATFATPDGTVETDYDFIHVVPPMHAPRSLADSALAWQEGKFARGGWLEVDPFTLRHLRYPNVFGVGDVNGVPKGKTAASVKLQAATAAANLVDVIGGKDPAKAYNGYTSCPLVTGIGSAMLVEFDYDGNLIPSFPFIEPLEQRWVSWVIEDKLLRPVYYAMLRGVA